VTAGRLAGRIALVTGASRGIGAAVARRFAREGAKLVLVARTTGGLQELDDDIRKISGESATLVPMDLTDYDKIDHMGALLFERFGHLDVLVGNAAMLGTLSPLGHTDPKVWERTLAVNLTANWRLIRAMDPLLKRSKAGRAIFVTSTVGAEPRAYWSAYSVSKAGLEMLARTYAAENAKTKVKVNLINPGGTRTALRAQAMPGENPDSVKLPDDVTEAFVDLAEAGCKANGTLIDCR
jgi:NAD(P)-dependent dehydrogenase (short-subunit alcohol dehydrogenase family)